MKLINSLIISFAIIALSSCNNNDTLKEEIEAYNISISNYQDSLQRYSDSLTEYKSKLDKCLVEIDAYRIFTDSLKRVNDSLNTELYISNFKIERVKYYNSIAAKNNNIKYLRGWINRALSDEVE